MGTSHRATYRKYVVIMLPVTDKQTEPPDAQDGVQRTEHNVVNCAVVEWILLIVRLNVNFHRNRRQVFHTLAEKGIATKTPLRLCLEAGCTLDL